jgi:hypothetical protein
MKKEPKINCYVCRNSGRIVEVVDKFKLFKLRIGWEKSVLCIRCGGQPNFNFGTDTRETLQ